MRKRHFEKLLSPFQIKDVKLKNRMIKSPAVVLMGDKDGYVTQKCKDFYEALAKGGIGMIVMEMTGPDYPLGYDGFGDMLGMLRIDDDRYIPGFSELAQVIHRHNCPVFGEIGHGGPRHPARVTGLQPVSASELSYNETLELDLDAVEGLPIRALAIPEIQDIVHIFVKAAERFMKAGFDGIEVHAAHFYLLNAFMSRAYNKRDDAYGCQNLENRARFTVEIIRGIKEYVGEDFPVGVRMNGIELGLEKGMSSEESSGIARILEKAGVDYISVSGWGFGGYAWLTLPDQIVYPEPTKVMKPYVKKINKPGLLIPAAEAIKKVVHVPVIGVGRLDPVLGEWLLQKGKIDLVAMTRRLFADSELPNKVASGRLEDIRPCTACVQCEDRWEPRRCRINPAMGHEREHAIKPARKKKRIMVIGGGPAGMEAAMTARIKGHEVSLYDREPKLGGLLPLASVVKGSEPEDLQAIIRYYKTQFDKLGVKTRLGKVVAKELVTEINPDAVIIATGGNFKVLGIPGMDMRKVTTSADLHRWAKRFLRFLSPGILRWLSKFYLPVGKQVVIVGGAMHGCETAEFLIKRGRKVSIVEETDELAKGMPLLSSERLISWLVKKGTLMLTGVRYEKITDEGLAFITKEGHRRILEADTILLAIPPEPNVELFEALKGEVGEVHLIGDCREPGVIADAVADGRRIACAV